MKTDQQLQQDILDELKWDPLLKVSDIGVSVKSGVVTLSGYVDSYPKKHAAENAAKRVKGVTAVAEDIVVRFGADGYRDDTAIAEAAVNALKWNTTVPEEQVKLKVENGWVTLEGNLDWQYQKDAAYNAIRNLTGVKGVSNLLSLKPRVSAMDIEKNIRKALHRSADIEADNIEVSTIGSKVVLEGKVRSWSERKEVEKVVWSAPGVLELKDDLVITS